MTSAIKKILIVEDEPDTAEMFAEMMRMSGYEIYKAYNGSSAVALVRKEKPAAVVLDLMMPDLSGLEVLRLVRNDVNIADTPVIVVSAKSLPSDIKDGLEAGASVYLTKPVGYLDLKAAVENAIRSSGKASG
ncbi:MAG TPA: response regulator [Anaerolineales bacterium]|nr:response regulator [Anaerolineales bacterium]